MMSAMPMNAGSYPGYEQQHDPNYGGGFVHPGGWAGEPAPVNGVQGEVEEGNDSYDKSYEAVDVGDPNGWQAQA